MNAEKILRALVSGAVGAVIMYCAKGLQLEGRVAAMEHGISRIEAHLDRIAP